MPSHNNKRPVGKKLIIACDGTWMNSDMGYDKAEFAPPTAQVPSNVTRIVRALKHKDSQGIPQIAFYERGCGTDGNEEDKVLSGITGSDLSEHVREAYSMIADNYDPETQEELDDGSRPRDDIVLLGFSRGAFTARAVASLISDVGLLTKVGMESFWGIYGDWMKQDMKSEETTWFEKTFGDKIAFTDPDYRGTLVKNGLTRWGMPIRAIGVWDTVGALGIPRPWHAKDVKAYSLVNAKVARQVQHAFQALALDEHRKLYSPTLWEEPDGEHKLNVLKQCWFAGVHSNIGGSYADAGISNITLAWMISQLEDNDGGILTFDPQYLDWVQDMNVEYYESVLEPIRPWGFGTLYDSMTGALGRVEKLDPITRTPGRYFRIDTETGNPTAERLKNTHEVIHRSVRVRIDGGGPGTEEDKDKDKSKKGGDFKNLMKRVAGLHVHDNNNAHGSNNSVYNSPALSNYELVQSTTTRMEVDYSGAGPSGVIWVAKDGLEPLFEDTLGRTEIRLLNKSQRSS